MNTLNGINHVSLVAGKKIENNHFAIFAGGFGTLSTTTPRSECCFVSMYSKANHILNLMKPCRCRCGIWMKKEKTFLGCSIRYTNCVSHTSLIKGYVGRSNLWNFRRAPNCWPIRSKKARNNNNNKARVYEITFFRCFIHIFNHRVSRAIQLSCLHACEW